MKVSAVIFDMDGVISDTQMLHAELESELLAGYGIRLSPDEISRRFAGVSDQEMFAALFAEAGRPIPDAKRITTSKYARMMSPATTVPEIPGTRQFIDMLHARGTLMAVASASPIEFVRFVIESLGLADSFKALVSAEDVPRGKPAPDVFLRAASLLDKAPQECVVIEDGVSGMNAAKAAGMKCIALLTHRTAAECPSTIDIAVNDLRNVPPSFFD